jgi:Ca2+/Na+ antiporter
LHYLGFAGKSVQLSGSWWILVDHGVSLLLLVLFFLDETLEIWENIVLILIYGIYCLVVTFNGKMKNCIIRKCSKASETGNVQMEDIANPDGDNMVSVHKEVA